MRVACINVGTKYDDVYVQRLYNMCLRHLPREFSFTCFTDRRRDLNPAIEQRDCTTWNLEGWWTKLRLFDKNVLNEEFLFLDLDNVIVRDLGPLCDFATASKDASIIGMRDFHYDTFGSTAMLVRPDDITHGIWEAFAKGEGFENLENLGRKYGDQDYIDEYVRSRRIEAHISFWPDEWFLSYKALRKRHAADPSAARDAIEQALMIVFHGKPKQHQLLNRWSNLYLLAFQKPLRLFSYWRFLEREVRQWWQ
ncbi:MAG: hypothetical protein C4341_07110 [Armatimonadota bacterium]